MRKGYSADRKKAFMVFFASACPGGVFLSNLKWRAMLYLETLVAWRAGA